MGEVVLITGCSRGIGLGLVDYFAKAGFKVETLIIQFILLTGSISNAFFVFGVSQGHLTYRPNDISSSVPGQHLIFR